MMLFCKDCSHGWRNVSRHRDSSRSIEQVVQLSLNRPEFVDMVCKSLIELIQHDFPSLVWSPSFAVFVQTHQLTSECFILVQE